MTNSKIVYGIVGVMVVGGVGLFLHSKGFFKPKEEISPKDNLAIADLEYVKQTDKYNLQNPDQASEGEIIKAFRRLSGHADEELKYYITQYKNHESEKIRAAVVSASGPFKEFRSHVVAALDDTSPRIRLAALQALGRQGHKDSKDILLNHIAKKDTTYRERVEVHKSLIKVAADAEERERNILALVDVVNAVPKERAAPLLMNLFRLAPNHQKIISLARESITGESEKFSDVEVQSSALQYSNAYDKQWLATIFADIKMFDDGFYQRVIIDIARAECLPGAKSHLDKIRAEPADKNVDQLIKEVSCP